MKNHTQGLDYSAFDRAPEYSLFTQISQLDRGERLLIFSVFAVVGLSIVFIDTFGFVFSYLVLIGIAFFIIPKFIGAGSRNTPKWLEVFATKNGFKVANVEHHNSEASIYSVGNDDHQSFRGVKGRFCGYSFTLYLHSFSWGINEPKDCMYAVIELDLPKNLPHIFIDNKKGNSWLNREILTAFNDSQLVQLEGNFSRYFNVYSVPGYHIPLLTLLNPGFMGKLMDYRDHFELEFLDNKAYMYFANEYIDTKESMSRVFSGIEFIITELQKQLDTFEFDPDDRSV